MINFALSTGRDRLVALVKWHSSILCRNVSCGLKFPLPRAFVDLKF